MDVIENSNKIKKVKDIEIEPEEEEDDDGDLMQAIAKISRGPY